MKNIITKIVIIFLLFNSSTIFSQEKIINGTVLDSLKKPIQYANVGLLHNPIGTVTDESGIFTLNIDYTKVSDTLKISSLGYKSQEFIVQNLLNEQKIIYLKNHTEELDEVLIFSNNLKTFTDGKEKTKSNNQVFFASPKIKNRNLGSQIGRKFSLKEKKPSQLTQFEFYIKENNFEKIKLRINFYDINDQIPSNRINKTDIFAEIQNTTGWIKVDLTDYNILIKNDIIVTIEWIEASENGDTLSLPILVPSMNSSHYYKQSAQSKWKKYKMVSSPMLLTYKQ